MSRIEAKFAALKKAGRAGFVTFVTAGDPDLETSSKILSGLARAGADIIELGMPFSDPMADGPAVQASSLRALSSGANMKQTLAMVREFRNQDDTTPIVLMGYFNPIYIYGTEKFVTDAKAAGIDGLIVVDLPPEESELQKPASAVGLDFIFLATPTSDDKRLPSIVKHASGFIYYVAIAGITGTRAVDAGAVATALTRLRKHTKLPITVGFGVKTPEHAAQIAKTADAVAVGSALVDKVREGLDGSGKATQACVDGVLTLARDLAKGVRSISK
jgi:tryptophan synthase alpha chain